jgi:hypothetical protein
MLLSRRGFVSGLIAFPAIVQASSLMRIATIIEPAPRVLTLGEWASLDLYEINLRAIAEMLFQTNDFLNDLAFIPRDASPGPLALPKICAPPWLDNPGGM